MNTDRYLNESLRIQREGNALRARANDYARVAEQRKEDQAALAQGAFELAQRVPSIAAHARQNAFEGALLAEAELRWMQKIGLQPEVVADFAMKQAVGSALVTLQQIVQHGSGTASPQSILDALVLQSDLLVRLGPNPEEIVERVRREYARAQRFRLAYALAIVACAACAVVGFSLKYNGQPPFDPAVRESVFGSLVWGAGVWLLVGYAFLFARRSWSLPSFRDNYEAFGQWYDAWTKFAVHPGGLPLAQHAWQHIPNVCEQVSQRLMLGVLPPGAIAFAHDASSEIVFLHRGDEARITRYEPGYYYLDVLRDTPVRADRVTPMWGRTTTRWER